MSSQDAKKKLFEESTKVAGLMDSTGYSFTMPHMDSSLRCKRRWVDLEALKSDLRNPMLMNRLGKPKAELLMRERELLFVQCVESKPGQEPQNPFLYPRYA